MVVGSANLDIVVPVPRHPRPGETILGGDHDLVPGGKGANQAVAAARLGTRTFFVGATGNDDAGDRLRSSLSEAGVGIDHVRRLPNVPSGIAMITVDAEGENSIVVSPGANARLSPADVEAAGELISSADAVLVQLEIPVATVAAVVDIAGGTVVLDPAPVPAGPLPDRLMDRVDVLVPNESELAGLAGLPRVPTDGDEIIAAARSLGPRTVVVTLGDRGAIVVSENAVETCEAPIIEAVDTTGAGDAFRAALVGEMMAGRSPSESVGWAVMVGSATTLVSGAQTSFPTRAQVESRLGR